MIYFLSSISLTTSHNVHREETFEVRNKGTPQEETVLNGLYWFTGADGFRYTIEYTIDKNGIRTGINLTEFNRTPLPLLKILVG